MTSFFELFLQQLIATSIYEWVAVVFAIGYLILAVKENDWCWPAAFVSTAIYSVLFFDVNLYMESLLNVYYLIMAIYGWYQWHYITEGEAVKPIIIWSVKRHIIIFVSTTILVLLTGFLLLKYTDQDFAYIDSFTTWFAIIATYMVTQKVLENWLYWIVINTVSVYLFAQKGLALTSILIFSYIIIAMIGWLKWKQHYSTQTQKC